MSGDAGRLKSTENGRNQFRNGRMNWYCPLKVRVGRFCIHRVEYSVDGFITASPEDRRAEDLLRAGVGNDLHET